LVRHSAARLYGRGALENAGSLKLQGESARPAVIEGYVKRIFQPVSPVPIAVYRILLGVLIIGRFLLLAPHWLLWFGRLGAIARQPRLPIGGFQVDLLRFWPQQDWGIWLLLCIALSLSLALTLGIFTRIANAGVFIVICALQARNPYILNAADHLIRIMVLYLLFSNAGAALSVDRLLALRRGKAPIEPSKAVPWAVWMMRVQIAVIYLEAGISKAHSPLWNGGTALYYIFQNSEIARFGFQRHITLAESAIGSSLTTAIEILFPLLVWPKQTRYLMLGLGALLHLGIEVLMKIPLLSGAMMTAYVVFLDADDLALAHDWLRKHVLGRHLHRMREMAGNLRGG
jgi:hypothetical protein